VAAQSKKGKKHALSTIAQAFFFFCIGFNYNRKKPPHFLFAVVLCILPLFEGPCFVCPQLFFLKQHQKSHCLNIHAGNITQDQEPSFFHRPSILCYHDFLNANFTVPKHFSCTFTASYQHTITFPGTCSASPGKGYENNAMELCWCITHSHCT